MIKCKMMEKHFSGNIYFLGKTRNQENHSFLQKRDLPYKHNGSGRYFRPKTLKTHFPVFWPKSAKNWLFALRSTFVAPVCTGMEKRKQISTGRPSKRNVVLGIDPGEVFLLKNALLRFFPFWSEKAKKYAKNRKFRAKSKIPHMSAFSRKWAQNTYKRHWF